MLCKPCAHNGGIVIDALAQLDKGRPTTSAPLMRNSLRRSPAPQSVFCRAPQPLSRDGAGSHSLAVVSDSHYRTSMRDARKFAGLFPYQPRKRLRVRSSSFRDIPHSYAVCKRGNAAFSRTPYRIRIQVRYVCPHISHVAPPMRAIHVSRARHFAALFSGL